MRALAFHSKHIMLDVQCLHLGLKLEIVMLQVQAQILVSVGWRFERQTEAWVAYPAHAIIYDGSPASFETFSLNIVFRYPVYH